MNILAMDIGKFNTVFCDYISESGEHEFGKVKTTPHAVHDLIVEKEPQRVVMEVSNIAGWIVDIARVLGKETETANTSHDAWRWKNVKRKNDKEDALKLAKLSAMNQSYQLCIINALVRVISSAAKRSREIWILTKLAFRSQPDLSTSGRSAALRSR
jgi:hypothetical protein